MSIQAVLKAWVAEQLAAQGLPLTELQAIQGDAGFRSYYRLQSTPPMLAVYGPPASEKHREFVQISDHWRTFGVPAPQVFGADLARGFLLIEDFGPQSLALNLQQITSTNSPATQQLNEIAGCYQPVLDKLLLLQTLTPLSWYPLYDREALALELNLFTTWFVKDLLNYRLTDEDHGLLQAVFDVLIDSALGQPQIIVHRDFHCRNIQIRLTSATMRVGFIDFQDAVLGPISYDLVSLLKDCYQRWPSHFVRHLALSYRQRLPAQLQMASADRFLRAFDLMGLQRHLKVLGIFSRLHLRDGKTAYLQDLPLVVAYVRQALAQFPELTGMRVWFDEALMPRIEQQPWYRSVVIQP
jgi:aminoglycoside/choline kinase family phosphotransferase